jgi:hypothetical protein
MPAPTPVMELNTNLAIGCTIFGLLAVMYPKNWTKDWR